MCWSVTHAYYACMHSQTNTKACLRYCGNIEGTRTQIWRRRRCDFCRTSSQRLPELVYTLWFLTWKCGHETSRPEYVAVGMEDDEQIEPRHRCMEGLCPSCVESEREARLARIQDSHSEWWDYEKTVGQTTKTMSESMLGLNWSSQFSDRVVRVTLLEKATSPAVDFVVMSILVHCALIGSTH